MADKGMNAGKARTDWANVHANRAGIDMRPWKLLDWGDSCPECGCEPEVRTDLTDDGRVWDGDEIRCSGKCGITGQVMVFASDDASIYWFEESDLSAGEESRPGDPSHIKSLAPEDENLEPRKSSNGICGDCPTRRACPIYAKIGNL